uniref:PPIase cyclophilin-type domain-containing protein n=1 Tax=Manihot esculenta TaxID=3983 RepID=A0A2C9UBP6_MANES
MARIKPQALLVQSKKKGPTCISATTIIDASGSFTDSKKYHLPGYAVLNTSNDYMTVELYKDCSRGIVDKFLDSCQKCYFKGMPFHHVIKHYVIQGGGGDSQGLGAAEDWTTKVKLRSRLDTIQPRIEIFMTTAPIPDLSDKHIVFGRVIKGEDVAQEIEEVDTDEHYRPKSPIGIINVTLKREI